MSTDLANRLRKRQRHLKKWARRTGVTCYRVYDRDLPDQPLVVDWYDGDAVAWLYERTRDETEDQDRVWRETAIAAVCDGLDLPAESVVAKHRRRQRGRHEGSGQYEPLSREGRTKVVTDVTPRVEVNLSDYVDTGLFLDHRPTRLLVGAESRGKRFLNLFAYTGVFSCHAALGEALRTTSVDLSRTYCDWAARNLRLNGFEPGTRHRIVRDDVREYLREARRRNWRWDLIVCDPPTFSVSKRMEGQFDVQRDHPQLLRDCADVLARHGTLLFSTNRHGFRLADEGLPDLEITDLTEQTTSEDFLRRPAHRCWSLRQG